MTVAQIKARVLALLDETGSGDYDYKILQIIDTLQRQIATTVKPIVKTAQVLSVDAVLTLPADCFELIGIWDNNNRPTGSVAVANGQVQITNCTEDGIYYIRYNAFPAPLTQESDLLELDEACCDAVCYGTAAELLVGDPEYPYFLSKYSELLVNIAQRSKKVWVTRTNNYKGW